MNRAWQQVGKINDANRKLNEALLSKLVNNAIFKKHFVGAKADKLMRTTAAMQHLVWDEASNSSVNQVIEDSVIPGSNPERHVPEDDKGNPTLQKIRVNQ